MGVWMGLPHKPQPSAAGIEGGWVGVGGGGGACVVSGPLLITSTRCSWRVGVLLLRLYLSATATSCQGAHISEPY